MSSTASETTTEAGQTRARPRREALNETAVWHVFARRKYDEPLHEIGNVMADDVELAKVYARSIYDEFSWIEMVLVPRQSIVKVMES
jgi:1,2-phenylacetyl-CoA epoxidase PaaB subunit